MNSPVAPRPRRAAACHPLCVLALAGLLPDPAPASPAPPPAGTPRQVIEALGESIPRGGSSQAIVALSRFLKTGDPALRAEAGYHLGLACLFEGKRAEAMAAWEKALAAAPPRGDIWSAIQVAMGDLHQRNGDFEKALLAYDTVLDGRQGGRFAFDAAVASGDARMKRKEYALAVKAYAWAEHFARTGYERPADAGDLGRKLAEARRLLDVYRNGADEVLFREAERLRGSSRWREARERYERMTVAFRESRYAPPSAWAVGDCLVGEGRLDDAITHWKQLIRLDEKGPWRGQAFVSLGDLFLEKRLDFQSARKAYERACQLYESDARQTPGWPEIGYAVYQRQGLIAYVLNRRDEAVRWFSKASLTDAPRPYLVVFGQVPLGIEAVVSKLRMRVEITPPEARGGRPETALLLVLADVHYEAEDYAKSRPLHERILDPETKADRLQRAWALIQLGRTHNWEFEFDAALKRYQQLLDKHPDCPWAPRALLLMAAAYHNGVNQRNEALRCYDRLLRDYPQSEDAERGAYYKGWLLFKGNRPKEARAAYHAFLARFPRSAYADAVKRDLEAIRESLEPPSAAPQPPILLRPPREGGPR